MDGNPVCYINGTQWLCDLSGAGSASEIFVVEDYDSAYAYEAWGRYGGTLFCCSSIGASGLVNVQVEGSAYNDSIHFHWGYGGTDHNLQPDSGSISGTIHGNDGDDYILGSNAYLNYIEYLWGDDDRDLIVGLSGDDNFNAGNDDDTCDGGTWDDLFYGGAGDDDLIGSTGNDVMWGGDGYDSIFGGADDDEIHGDGDDDTIHGDYDGILDLIYGGNGNDYLYGDGGIDEIYGDVGADSIWGGSAADTLYGNDGADIMRGDAGNDVMDGGADNDVMAGGADDDFMTGGADADTLCGDGQTAIGDELDDGDTSIGVDLLWSNETADFGVWCGNTSTQYDCKLTPLSGAATCSSMCLSARPAGCPT